MLKMREHGPEQGGRYETGWILTKFEKESELQSLTRQCVNQTFYRWKLCEKYQRHGISVFSLFWMEAVHRSNGSSLTCNIFFFRFFLYTRWRDFRRIQTLLDRGKHSQCFMANTSLHVSIPSCFSCGLFSFSEHRYFSGYQWPNR